MAKKLFRDKAADDVGGAAALTTADLKRLRSGFDSTNWNAAVSFQCAVRDCIDRPVTLEQALRFGKLIMRKDTTTTPIEVMRQWFDEEVTAHTSRRAEERRRERESVQR